MPIRILPLLAVAAIVALGLYLPAAPSGGDPNLIRIVSSLPRTGSAKG